MDKIDGLALCGCFGGRFLNDSLVAGGVLGVVAAYLAVVNGSV